MLWAKYGGTAADVKEAIVGGSLTEVSHAQAGYMTGDCNDRYYVLDMAQAYRYRRQITDQEFLAIPWVFYGEMPDCGQENLRLEIGGIYGDGHLAHIRNQWAFHLSHERKVEKGDKVFEYNGECYGQFYPPQKDRDGNWWLRLMPVNAEPSVTGLDGYGGKLCLTKHCHWGYTSMDADGNMVEGRYEEPYGVRDLGLFQVFPRGTDVPELPRYMPEGKVKDGKLNCTMLYQEAEIPGYGGYVYCTR